ncbi:MAG: hypothetical protein ACI9U2_005237 [Bradymonadia bacterium]|jgi:hypothetical protein
MGAGRDVRLVYEDASLNVQDVVVFGDNDPDNWGEPDVAIAGDTVVVAAYNRTDNEVWTRVKVGASPWQAPRKLLAFDPLVAVNGAVLAVAARQHQGGLRHSVLAQHESGVWYAEHRPKGAQPAPKPSPPVALARTTRRLPLCCAISPTPTSAAATRSTSTRMATPA